MLLTLKNIVFNPLDGEESNKWKQIVLSVLLVQERDGEIQRVVMSKHSDVQPGYMRLWCLIFWGPFFLGKVGKAKVGYSQNFYSYLN